MWSFWRSKKRFSLDELRYLTDQLGKVQIVNDVNKDFVVEALRSIAELITYGDQHDSSYFDFFMEKQVMGEFVRILKISKSINVSLQLLQTISIMIQNLKNEHAIYYLFSNEHINYLITYSFDFNNEELLSYYISFLRAVSGKLNKNTISLLVKTQDDEVVAFPLYVEAIRYAFHNENMVRTAVRALTLNVYHVGDVGVTRFIARPPQATYFTNLVKFFRKQCLDLNSLVSEALDGPGSDKSSTILSAVDEIEDSLYYFSDITSAGIPDVGALLTDGILKDLVFPLLLPSLETDSTYVVHVGPVTSLYLICCILHILKTKDLANIIAAGLFCSPEAFVTNSIHKENGDLPEIDCSHESKELESGNFQHKNVELQLILPNSSSGALVNQHKALTTNLGTYSSACVRETLLSYIRSGSEVETSGSLSVLAMLLQTKELDETMLDALGILPQRKKHKKQLLEALVGEASAEEQLFSSETRDVFSTELDGYLQRIKSQYEVSSSTEEEGSSPRVHRSQVLDALVTLFCRSDISADTLWDGGWLLRQLLPHGEADFSSHHLRLLREAYRNWVRSLILEIRGVWPDLLVTVLSSEWGKCKRAMEASKPRKEPNSILLSLCLSHKEGVQSDSSFGASERMLEVVKVLVLLHQLLLFSAGRILPEKPPIDPRTDNPDNSRAKAAGIDVSGPKPGTEINLVDALSCRIAFERGRERHLWFIAVAVEMLGWVILAEELPLKQHKGIVRVAAPLAGSNPRIDDKHPKWLHLRIRPSSLQPSETSKSSHGSMKSKPLVDGRWTLAFRDEVSCKSAMTMVREEMQLQSREVERRLKPLLNLEEATRMRDDISQTP
ncbi:hypothetical protein MLD38_006754 [Melastoma candidum]|uniref:Uncharacterized protein n=1 Tax=Melastoma candidum TaxID=119954 RepID=A0ACB9RNL5_9MYRT|nr:hypothetical protein MLD38_006754 [Melastoma candidum]